MTTDTPTDNKRAAVHITSHPYKGRCFYTSKDVETGETLLACHPYAMIPDTENKLQMCCWCMTVVSRQLDDSVEKCHSGCVQVTPCQHCNQVAYCGDECRENDWRTFHRFECGFFKKLFVGAEIEKNFIYHEVRQCVNMMQSDSETLRPHPDDTTPTPNQANVDNYTLDFTWLLIRILIRRFYEFNGTSDENTAQLSTEMAALTFEDVWKSCSNASSFTKAKIEEFVIVASVLHSFLQSTLFKGKPVIPNDFLPSPTIPSTIAPSLTNPIHRSLLELICKEECNSFGMYTFLLSGPKVTRQGYGLAMYPLAVYFNHSCCPNVGHYISDGGVMTMYATTPIANGSEACISYVALEDEENSDVLERRKFLKEVFHFDCDCKRCDYDLYKLKINDSSTQYDASYLSETASLVSPTQMVCKASGCKGRFVPSQLISDVQDGCKWTCEACFRGKETL